MKSILPYKRIPPTIIEILGTKGDNYFFGKSFFEKGPSPSRAFISNYQELDLRKIRGL